MNTLQDTISYAKEKQEKAFIGFYIDPLITFMSLDDANNSGLFKTALTADEWKHEVKEFNRDNVLHEMRDYLKFGFEKAHDQRGLSAARTIQKMQTWLYMLADDLCESIEEYTDYGLPQLRVIDGKYFNGEVEKEYNVAL